MAGEALEKAGMHFDDLNRIRVLDEDTASQVYNISGLRNIREIVTKHLYMWTADIWHETDCIPQAQELREVCQDFLGDIGDFQKIADSFIVIFDAVSKEVETEKMKVWSIQS